MSSDHTLRLYNTLSHEVEPVEPIEEGHLRFYSCGPTVYDFAHIGNFRSFLTADLIVRTAEALGWETTFVSNVTDVGHLTEDDLTDPSGEDRMAKALRREGQRFPNIYDLARFYTATLIDDWRALNLREPDVRPRATEHVSHQIKAVERLVEKGHAYETEQGIYFSVESFPDYGKLSGNDAADQLQATDREVVSDPEKRDARDFALWKKDPKHLMQWHSPWGWGFPGWHIECSVMSAEYLDEQIDIHAGGEDLIFPHHECEIAQAESLTGKEPFARHWVHTRFLQVEGEKMSKSKDNFFTVRDLIAPEEEGGRGIDPLALRYTLLSGQYRKPFNFTFETLQASVRHVRRFREADALVDERLEEDTDGRDFLGEQLQALYDRMLGAMCDDLNTPEALAAALEGVKLIHGASSDMGSAAAQSARRWLDWTNALLGIVSTREGEQAQLGHAEASARGYSFEVKDELAEEVEALLEERAEARAAKDYERADAIRDRLDEMGIEVMDTPEGTEWRRKVSI